MNIFQVPAVIDGVAPLKDRGMSIRFHTNELTDEQKLEILKHYQKYGWLLFKESESNFTEDEVPDFDPKEFDEQRSPAERLRAVVYVYARDIRKIPEEDKKAHRDFYVSEMERIINAYKKKLP
jgi:hypothetical protein